MAIRVQVQVENLRALDSLVNHLEKMGSTSIKTAKSVKQLTTAYKQTQAQLRITAAALQNIRAGYDSLVKSYATQQGQLKRQSVLLTNITKKYAALAATEGKVVKANTAIAASNTAVGSAMRGAAGAAGKLWLSYGQLLPMLAGFAAGTVAVKAFQDSLEFDYLTRYAKAVEGVGGSLQSVQKDLLSIRGTAATPVALAEGLREFVKAGLSSADVISQQLLPAMSKFATVAEMGLADSIQLAVTQVNAFGEISEISTGKILDFAAASDMMAQAVFSAPISFKDLQGSLSQTTELATTVGASFDEVVTALSIMGEAGIKGTKAGTALRTGLTKLLAPTEKLKATFAALGVNMAEAFNEDGTANVKKALGLFKKMFEQLDKPSQISFAKDVFGLRAQKIISIIARLDEWDDKNREILESSGKVNKSYEEIKDSLKVAATRFAAAFSSESITKLLPVIDTLGGAMGGAVKYADNLAAALVNVAEVLAIGVVGYMITAIPVAVAWLGKLTIAAGAFGTVMSTTAGVLTAFFAGWKIGTYLLDEFQGVSDFAIGMTDAVVTSFLTLKHMAQSAWLAISSSLAIAVDAMQESWALLFDGLANQLEKLGSFSFEIPGMKDPIEFAVGEDVIDRLRDSAKGFREGKKAIEEYEEAKKKLSAAQQQELDVNDEIIKGMQDESDARFKVKDATVAHADAAKKLIGEVKTGTTDLAGLTKGVEENAKAAKKAAGEADRLAESLSKLKEETAFQASLAGLDPYKKKLAEIGHEAEEVGKKYGWTAEQTEAWNQKLLKLPKNILALKAANREVIKSSDDLFAGFIEGAAAAAEEMKHLGEIGFEIAGEVKNALGKSLVAGLKGDWAGIKDIWAGVLDSLLTKAADWAVDTAWSMGQNLVSNIASGITTGSGGIGDAISDAMSGDYGGAISALTGGGTSGAMDVNVVRSVCCGGAGESIVEKIGDMLDYSDVAGGMATAFAAYTGWDAVATEIGENFGNALDAIPVGEWTSSIGTVLDESYVHLADSFTEVATEAYNSADIWSVAADNMSDSVSLVGDTWAETVDNFSQMDTSWFSEMKTGVSEFTSGVKDSIANMVGGAENLSTLVGVAGAAASAYGLYSGIKEMAEGNIVSGGIKTAISGYGAYTSAVALAPEAMSALSTSITSAFTAAAPEIGAATAAGASTGAAGVGAGVGALAGAAGAAAVLAAPLLIGISQILEEDPIFTTSQTVSEIGDKQVSDISDQQWALNAQLWVGEIQDTFNEVQEGLGDNFTHLRAQIEPTAASVETFVESLTGVGISSAQSQMLLQEGLDGSTISISNFLQGAGASLDTANAAAAGLVASLDQTTEAEYKMALVADMAHGTLIETSNGLEVVAGKYNELTGSWVSGAEIATAAVADMSAQAVGYFDVITHQWVSASEVAAGAAQTMATQAKSAADAMAQNDFHVDMSASATIVVDVIGDATAAASAETTGTAQQFRYFASGGLLEGGSGVRDDLYLGMVNGSRIIAQGGEFIMNPEATKKNLPLLRQMNAETFASGGSVGNYTSGPATSMSRWRGDSINLLTDAIDDFNKVIRESQLTDYANSVYELNQRYNDLIKDLRAKGTVQADIDKANLARSIELSNLNKQRRESLDGILLNYRDVLAARSDYQQSLVDESRKYDDVIEQAKELGATNAELAIITKGYRKTLDELAESHQDAIHDFMGSYDDIIATVGMTDYEKQVRALNEKYADARDRAEELGLSEANLARIERARLIELEGLADSSEAAFTNLSDVLQEIKDYGLQGFVTGGGDLPPTMHALGGIASSAHFIGEAGPEAILPLRHPEQINHIEDKIDNVLSNRPMNFQVFVGTKELTEDIKIIADDVAYTRQDRGIQGRLYPGRVN